MIYPTSLGICLYALLGTVVKPKLAQIRQTMVDAEYVVEERVENYVPPTPTDSTEKTSSQQDDDADADWLEEEDGE
jgi:hypothetical protein